MKITTNQFAEDRIVMSLEAENQAEQHQLKDLMESLTQRAAVTSEWGTVEGRRRISVAVMVDPEKKSLPSPG